MLPWSDSLARCLVAENLLDPLYNRADLSILRMPLPLFEAILTMFHFDEQDAVGVHTNAVQPAESITTPQFSASASPVTTPSIIIPNPQSSERLGWDTALYPVNKAGQNQNTPCARRDRSARTPNPWYSGDVRPNNVHQPVEGEEIIQFVTFAIPVKHPDSPSRRDSSSSGYIHSSQTRKEAPNIIPNWERYQTDDTNIQLMHHRSSKTNL
ncbi:hypothetical protein BLNAU_21401 [Blattamonas nauphoetae]|uniref:Uncharacterized protein n=1 Tax=Blattamonas nauphoetae TaxID=2049346 RepID=A0ABQ9WWK4_9EUKA|nr:hypothetical protein BLNAU_21401 [Blattamonas nauphoetae]